MIRLVIIVSLLASHATFLKADYQYHYNSTCREAHQALLEYNLSKAKSLLSKEKKENPDNLIPVYLANYLDFFQMVSYENPDLYDTLGSTINNRLEKLSKGPENSPFHYFTRGEIQLQWSLIQFKMGDWFAGGRDFYNSYQLYESTETRFPGFLPVKKSILPIKALVGTLPGSYQWLAGLFGFSGNLEEAIQQYRQFLKNTEKEKQWAAYHEEGEIFYGFMQYHLSDNPDKAWSVIKNTTRDYKTNPASAFARSNIALTVHKNDEALQTLNQYKETQPAIPHLDYLLGNAMLYKLDANCRYYFARYIKSFKGHSYIKDSYLKMGWGYLLKGNTEQYKNCMYLVKNKGKAVHSEDKQAMKETDHYSEKNLYLLKARLLYDGGYFNKAMQQFQGKRIDKNEMRPSQYLEHYYRIGRIEQARKNTEKALDFFQKIMSFDDPHLDHYYVPAAYLQSALIYEKRQAKGKARENFKKVLDFNDFPYEKSFSQRAKAGLKRLN